VSHVLACATPRGLSMLLITRLEKVLALVDTVEKAEDQA
jgi:hypothetical protein